MNIHGRTQRRGRGCKDERRKAGEERNAKWAVLTPAQKIAVLDTVLGKGQGAKRQREKLAS